ncbi:uncharacterized protein mRpL27 isoform X1 [Eurosta solidaginis]|uniref:uncharacterized protein mRpL27 isoform X1 n=1 Tax=Eurosta solidaginis TaxID=178769 RepID=UPI0035311716
MDTDMETAESIQADVFVPTKLLRDKIRQFSQRHREELRAKSKDALRFGLGEIHAQVEELNNITVKDVLGLVKRIKRRKHASVEEMYRFSHAFLQSIDNIKIFAKEPGALQIIIKELTGIDSERQIGAVECLCNLSLGEAPVCEKIANLAGSYLVTYLDSLDERLKRTSLWTIANIMATSAKAALVVVQMEIVSKLWNLYIDDSGDKDLTSDFREDAAVCLQLLVVQNRQVLRMEDLNFIKCNMCLKKRDGIGAEYHLQLLFHGEAINPKRELNMEESIYLIDYILENLCTIDGFTSISNRLRLLYGIRLLANILACQPHALNVLLQHIKEVFNTNVEDMFNKMFAYRSQRLTMELIYLLRQLLSLQENETQPILTLENLRIANMDSCMT